MKGKVIVIISREEWSNMRMSKQNYAVELANQGFSVYFFQCPDRRKRLKRGQIIIEETDIKSLKIIKHRLFFPLFLKYKLFKFYSFLFQFQWIFILRKINAKPEIIWSFDTEADIPLSIFRKDTLKIYMPVDGPFMHDFELINAKSAHLIVSVTDKILNRYDTFQCVKFKVNHGVSSAFYDSNIQRHINNQVTRIGYSGSLVRNDLKCDFFKLLIKENPNLIFEFWGEYDYSNSSIHYIDDISVSTKEFISFLKCQNNVVLHGAVNQQELAYGLNRMDVLLIAYNIENDQNHHKVNEYLTTGKPIVSTYMSSFIDSDLIIMAENNCSDEELYKLFANTMNNYRNFIKAEQIQSRMSYAFGNSYGSLTNRIIQEVSSIS